MYLSDAVDKDCGLPLIESALHFIGSGIGHRKWDVVFLSTGNGDRLKGLRCGLLSAALNLIEGLDYGIV